MPPIDSFHPIDILLKTPLNINILSAIETIVTLDLNYGILPVLITVDVKMYSM